MNVLELSDEALLQRAGSGEVRAFEDLYERFSPRLFGLVQKMLGDGAEAEEVLQECFVYLWDHARNYDPARSKAFTWATMIFRNRAIDRLRARGRRSRLAEAVQQEAEQQSWYETADHAGEQLQRAEAGSLVRRALGLLPVEQRRLIEQAFFTGHTHQAISEALGLPLGTVKTNIRRGLARLREMLTREEEGGFVS
jgi:RNA polymerase sigma-70 factor, ECF subfamily